MTTQELTKIAKVKFENVTVEDLKKEIIKLNDAVDTASSIVFDICMDILIEKINEKEFVKFCNKL